jgi:hypothetical protein
VAVANRERAMTDLDPDALEAAARAMIDISALGPWYRLDNPEKSAALDQARAAVTAYLDALAAQDTQINAIDAALRRAGFSKVALAGSGET